MIFDFSASEGALSLAGIGGGTRFSPRILLPATQSPFRPRRKAPSGLRHLECPPGAEQLQQVVGKTDQLPFRSHVLQSA